MARHFRAYGGLALGGLLVMGLMGLMVLQTRAPTPEEQYAASLDDGAATATGESPVPARVFWAERSAPALLASATAALERLRAGLAAEQIAERVEAIRQAASVGDERVLALLTATTLNEDPATAPTRILAVGALGQRLSLSAQQAAAETLSDWLAAMEHGKVSADRGHMALLVETLGKFECDRALHTLIAVLGDPQMPLHVQTLAVQALGRMDHDAARSALNAFRRGLAQRQMQDQEDAALVREAQAALAQAVENLTKSSARPWTTP